MKVPVMNRHGGMIVTGFVDRIKKMNIKLMASRLVIFIMLLQVVWIRWLTGDYKMHYLAILLAAYVFYEWFLKKAFTKADLIVYGIYTAVIILNLMLNGVYEDFPSYFFKFTLANLFIIEYIFLAFSNFYEDMKQMVLKVFYPAFNLIFFINCVIMTGQFLIRGFCMPATDEYLSNPLYVDHITGFFGASGTHRMSFFWILLILVNLFKILTVQKERQKRIGILLLLEILLMLGFSVINDNVAFYYFLPILAVQVLLAFRREMVIEMHKIGKKRLLMIGIGILVLINVVYILYLLVPSFNEFLNVRVIRKIYLIMGINPDPNSTVPVTEERLFQAYEMIVKGKGYAFGSGIGEPWIVYPSKLPVNYPISDMPLRILEGGILYYFIIIGLFTYAYGKLFFVKRKWSVLQTVFIYFDLFLLSAYTFVFRVQEIVICMVFIMFIFGMICKNRDDADDGRRIKSRVNGETSVKRERIQESTDE